jgi:transcription elongation factor SPT5
MASEKAPKDDLFGDDSDDEVAPPPPPETKDDDSVGELIKDGEEKNGGKGEASADVFGDSSDEDNGDVTTKKKIDRRKSMQPSDDEESDDDDDDSEDEDDDDSDDDDDDSLDDSDDDARKAKRAALDDDSDSDDSLFGGRGKSAGKEKKEKKEKKTKKKRRRDDDSDDGGKKKKKDKVVKKKKAKREKVGASRFFADEADEADDMSDDEQYEKDVTEEQLGEDELAARELVEQRHKKNREMLSTDAAELANKYEEQHKQERKRMKVMREMAGGSGVGQGTVAQQALLPSISDPSVWRIKCAPNKEFSLVRSILMKHIDTLRKGGKTTTLKSAFHSSSKGYIYVEAMSEVCAKEAVYGLRGLYFTTFTKVPLAEMTRVMVSKVNKKPISDGQWVRLRRGPLKGDLAKVVEVFDGGSRAFIMAVPRPDYSTKSKNSLSVSTLRPSQKIFDVVEASAATGIDPERRQHPADRNGEFYDYWKSDYYRDGFLFKEVGCDSYLNNEDVKPKLEELQQFKLKRTASRSPDEDEDDEDKATPSMQKTLMKDLAEQMKNVEAEDAVLTDVPFVVGDLVEVASGEMKGLIAQVKSTSQTSNVLEVVPYNNAVLGTQTLSIERDLLVKYIYPGAHVKIVQGRYMGATGRVVSVNVFDGDHLAAVLTDGINTEIHVNVGSVQLSSEVSSGHGNLGGYELYDLVSISENETACVIHVGAEKLRVINHSNIIKDLYPQDLVAKRNMMSKKSSAFDKVQHTIACGDQVKVVTGEYTGKSGAVKHIMRGNLWIHSNNHLKNSGVMVIRGRECLLAGGPGGGSTNKAVTGALGSTGAGAAVAGMAGQQIKTFNLTSGGDGGGGGGFNRDPSIGKTVKIIKGSYKGMLGQVCGVSPTEYSVDLLARVKKMMILKTKCKIVGDRNGSFVTTAFGGAAAGTAASTARPQGAEVVGPMADIATPFLTSETPVHMGAETPLHSGMGNETPMHAGGDGVDDIFNVNERDREQRLRRQQEDSRAAAAHAADLAVGAASASVAMGGNDASNPYGAYSQAAGAVVMSLETWPDGVILNITGGHQYGVNNRYGVLQSRDIAAGMCVIALIMPSGQLDVNYLTLHHSEVRLAEIRDNCYVRIVSGNGAGSYGMCVGRFGSDVLVKLDNDTSEQSTLYREQQCVVIYHSG